MRQHTVIVPQDGSSSLMTFIGLEQAVILFRKWDSYDSVEIEVASTKHGAYIVGK